MTKYTMTSSDVQKFARENKDAMLLLLKATEDYRAARCLMLNQIKNAGLGVAAQAVEKYLKAQLLFDDPTLNINNLRHYLKKIFRKVTSISPSLKTAKNIEIIKWLEFYYQRRYPDNPKLLDGKKVSMFSYDKISLDEIDQLIFLINEKLSIPTEVKFRTGLYGFLFIQTRKIKLFNEYWLSTKNEVFKKNKEKLFAEYIAVKVHFGEKINVDLIKAKDK